MDLTDTFDDLATRIREWVAQLDAAADADSDVADLDVAHMSAELDNSKDTFKSGVEVLTQQLQNSNRAAQALKDFIDAIQRYIKKRSGRYGNFMVGTGGGSGRVPTWKKIPDNLEALRQLTESIKETLQTLADVQETLAETIRNAQEAIQLSETAQDELALAKQREEEEQRRMQEEEEQRGRDAEERRRKEEAEERKRQEAEKRRIREEQEAEKRRIQEEQEAEKRRILEEQEAEKHRIREEKERLKKEAAERERLEEEERQRVLEEERQERLRKKRKEEERLRRQEEEERLRKIEEERLRQEEEERVRKEEIERIRKLEEERLRREEEERLRKEEEQRKRRAEERRLKRVATARRKREREEADRIKREEEEERKRKREEERRYQEEERSWKPSVLPVMDSELHTEHGCAIRAPSGAFNRDNFRCTAVPELIKHDSFAASEEVVGNAIRLEAKGRSELGTIRGGRRAEWFVALPHCAQRVPGRETVLYAHKNGSWVELPTDDIQLDNLPNEHRWAETRISEPSVTLVPVNRWRINRFSLGRQGVELVSQIDSRIRLSIPADSFIPRTITLDQEFQARPVDPAAIDDLRNSRERKFSDLIATSALVTHNSSASKKVTPGIEYSLHLPRSGQRDSDELSNSGKNRSNLGEHNVDAAIIANINTKDSDARWTVLQRKIGKEASAREVLTVSVPSLSCRKLLALRVQKDFNLDNLDFVCREVEKAMATQTACLIVGQSADSRQAFVTLSSKENKQHRLDAMQAMGFKQVASADSDASTNGRTTELRVKEHQELTIELTGNITSVNGDKFIVEFHAQLPSGLRMTNGKDSIAWHQDSEKSLGRFPTIASISLGSERKFCLRTKGSLPPAQLSEFESLISLRLQHGSLLTMTGSTQLFWQHSVPKELSARGPRINLTFRVNN